MHGVDAAGFDQAAHEVAVLLLKAKIDLGNGAFFLAFDFAQVNRLAQMPPGFADHDDHVAGALEGHRRHLGDVLHQPDAADGGRGQDAFAIGLVVERAIAADHREIQRPAGSADAVDAGDDFPHDFGLLRIAVIQIVGDGQRRGAHRGQVAPGFGHGLLAAFERIGAAIAGRNVGGDRQRLVGAMHAHHGGVAARHLHRVGHHGMVILLPHPAA